MDAKARKVLTGLTKLGGEQEVFDLSIAVKMTEDAVQALLGALSGEGLVSCRRDGGKEFWSVAEAKAAPAESGSGAKEPASGASGRKKGKATAAGPDDRFDEFIIDTAAAPPPAAEVSPVTATAEPAATDSFEPIPANRNDGPAKNDAVAEDDFEPKTPKKEKRAKADADADFEPKPEKEKPAKPSKKKSADSDETSEPASAKEGRAERELSAGPDDHFDEFAERVPSKPNLPIPLMAGAAVLVLIVILFIVGGGGGKTKSRIDAAVKDVKTEFTNKIDSLKAETAADIAKLRGENKALRDEVKELKAELRKAASSQDAAKKTAADNNKQKPGKKK